jgi:hypothetical protein
MGMLIVEVAASFAGGRAAKQHFQPEARNEI